MKNKLKTLKDLDLGRCSSFNIIVRGKQCDDEDCITCGYVKELKAEAVKWVKDLEGRFTKVDEKRGFGKTHNATLYYHISWIKLFFNLTEEDLG